MELTPAKFLALFLFLSGVGWLLFTFAARLVAWMVSGMIGAEVQFRVGAVNCLKDVSLNFKKGSMESLVIGEVRVRTCRSFTGSSNCMGARASMLQVFLYDAEVVLRKNSRHSTKARVYHQKKHSSGRGKWMLLANLAKYITVSVVELVVQMPNWTMEVKELDLGIDSEETGLSLLCIKLLLMSCNVYEREQHALSEMSCTISLRERLLSVGGLGNGVDGAPVPFSLESLSLNSAIGHEREHGMTMRQLDINCGEISMDISEELLHGSSSPHERSECAENLEPNVNPTKSNNLDAVVGDHAGKPHKFLTNVPEKTSFNLPRLQLKCCHKEEGFIVENSISGIHVLCNKTQNQEESRDVISCLDIHVDCGEIQLLQEADKSMVEIMKLAIAASLEVSQQPNHLLQAEVDVKLGGAQCNILPSKFEKWIYMLYPARPKKKDTASASRRKSTIANSRISWTCTLSAPDMAILLYNLDDVALYHACSQTSHMFINSALKQGTGFHTELGELHVYLVDEEKEYYKESLFGMDTNPGCLLQMSRITVDGGIMEPADANNEVDLRNNALVMEITSCALYLTLHRVQFLLSLSMRLARHFKTLLVVQRGRKLSKDRTTNHIRGGSRAKELKLHLEGFSVHFCKQLHVTNLNVPDPRKVNFGNQGGEVVLEHADDGKPRMANIKIAKFCGIEGHDLMCRSMVDIAHLHLCIDRRKGDTEVDLQRLRTVYQELGSDMKLIYETDIAGLQSGKIVYRRAMVRKGIPSCLVCGTDLRGRWEPDVHLFFHDVFLDFKTFIQKQKELMLPTEIDLKEQNKQHSSKGSESQENDAKKQGSAVAVDIEQMNFSAGLADGVEGSVSVASIFSEDFRIGILLEELKVSLNTATVLRSKRLQAARIPCFTQGKNKNVSAEELLKRGNESASSCWEYLIQGFGTRVIMPYRLECRAIEDAIEDMWRGLKLTMLAQKSNILGAARMKNLKNGKKAAKVSSSVGAVRFIFDSIIAEIEEEPLQGWFDEHHRLIRQQRLELSVRESLLDEVIVEGGRVCASHCTSPDLKLFRACGLNSIFEGKELDLSDPYVCQRLKEKLQEQAFLDYQRACKKLQHYEASGSSRDALQSGFRPSINRGSLFVLQASNLEVTLADIEGGTLGMVEQIRKLDCISPELQIPYSRILGKRVNIIASSLVIQLRDYTFPILSATGGKCDGQIIFARQATCFPKQVTQEVYIGRWRKLIMLRSQSGTTPPYKMFSELPIEFEKAEVAYGVGFEPAFADVSYAFTVALRKADLSVHDLAQCPQSLTGAGFYHLRSSITTSNIGSQPVKKERSLPWWDDMRYYVHGRNSIIATKFRWIFLATTDPYEKRDMMKIVAGFMDIQQQERKLSFFAKDFDLIITSLEHMIAYQGRKQMTMEMGEKCIRSPFFQLDITMDWDCKSGNSVFHYLHAFPNEGVSREKVYDPFRSTSLALRWNFRLGDSTLTENITGFPLDAGRLSYRCRLQNVRKSPARKTLKDTASSLPHLRPDVSVGIPTMNLGAHDLIWIFKWWGMYYSPPHKLRTFSKWPRFGLTRVPRSGNLSLDKVLTDFMLRVDATPARIKHVSLVQDDPAEGLTFNMKRLKYELCYSRGTQRYLFESKRDILELVYQGLELHMLRADLKRGSSLKSIDDYEGSEIAKVELSGAAIEPCNDSRTPTKSTEAGYFFTTEYFSLRKQAPKADLARLSSWQEVGNGIANISTTELAYGSGSDPARSDPSDDDGFNIVLPDNCLRVSLYGLKLLWTIANRDAVWAWVEDISSAFESPKPSPSRQYAQRKIMEEQTKVVDMDPELNEISDSGFIAAPSPSQDNTFSNSFPFRRGADSTSTNQVSSRQGEPNETEEEGTMHFMVNVVQPQFNLQSEDARGRFLLAAASGKVIARSFHSIMLVRPEMIAHSLRTNGDHLSVNMPELTWNRRELSVMLEQVQAHVAPTDVDPGAGLQWLPKIPKGAPKVKRTGALLERVFIPCPMYFQYTRCKSETADLKVKPLKELSFNSPNITATMTSRQFQVMVDIISNLLLARLPKPRKKFWIHYSDEEESVEEDIDDVVPDGVVEVELARVKLEESEREFRLLSDDFLRVKQCCSSIDASEGGVDEGKQEAKVWMMSCGKQTLVLRLGDDLKRKLQDKKSAAISLRHALQRAAQQSFKEKEKNKNFPFAMRISWAIDKIVWSMISDGEAFAEAEISNMILNVDRDYHEVGIAQLTAKHFVVKNCLPNAKSSTVLSAWNPPVEWGRNAMLRVDAKQGAPKDGHSPLELFQVEIYPLKIYLTETMYRMMWDYFFSDEDQDSQRQKVWKASTTAVVKRSRKMASVPGDTSSASTSKRENMVSKTRPSTSSLFAPAGQQHFSNGEWHGVDFRFAAQILQEERKLASAKNDAIMNHRRTSSFDRTWEEKLSETIALDIVPRMHTKSPVSSSTNMVCLQTDEGECTPQNGIASVNSSETGSAKLRDSTRVNKLHKTQSNEEKKANKSTSQDEKKSARLQRTYLEFKNIKISQVELLVTYEGSRLTVNELRLLMDTFTRLEFTGTWRRLFSRVKKHIIWGVLKSVTGMQGKKFKDKLQAQGHGEGVGYPGDESNSSDSEGSNPGIYEHFPSSKFKRQRDRAGEGFVSSIRGLFNSQRKKAKALGLRRGGEDEFRGVWTEDEADSFPFRRQLSISKTKRLLRRHAKRFISSTRHRGIIFKDQSQGSPSFQSEASSESSSCYEDLND